LIVNSKSVHNIIFDLGGILLHLDYPALLEGLAGLGIRQKPFPSDLEFLGSYETGEADTNTFLAGLGAIAAPGTGPHDLIRVWNSLLLGFPEEHVEMLARLKKKYRLFLLSNTNELHIASLEDRFRRDHPGKELADLFEKAYYSCRTGLRKPDPRIFAMVLQENGLAADETLFLDDTAEHVAGARTLGIQAMHVDLTKGMNTISVLNDILGQF